MANKTVTVKSSGGNYTSLNAALVGESANLVTGTCILTIECYASAAPDTIAANTGTGYTTSASYYINITVPSAERHDGKWNTSKYYMDIVTGNGLQIWEDYVRVAGLQIQVTDSGSAMIGCFAVRRISGASNDIRFSNCIAKGIFSGTTGYQTGFLTFDDLQPYATVTFWNCIAFDCHLTDYPTSGACNGYWNRYGISATYYNCTAYKCGWGWYHSTFGSDVSIATNCLSFCDEIHANNTDFNSDITGDYNLSTDATAPGAHSLINQITTDVDFVDLTVGAEDLDIQATSVCIGAGIDNPGSGLYSDDIHGRTRTSTWDIGAAEYVAAGGGPTNYPRSVVGSFPGGSGAVSRKGSGKRKIVGIL